MSFTLQCVDPVDTPRKRKYPPRRWTHTYAVRVGDEHVLVVDALCDALDQATPSEAFRWLLDQPEVRAVVRAAAQSAAAVTESGVA